MYLGLFNNPLAMTCGLGLDAEFSMCAGCSPRPPIDHQRNSDRCSLIAPEKSP